MTRRGSGSETPLGLPPVAEPGPRPRFRLAGSSWAALAAVVLAVLLLREVAVPLLVLFGALLLGTGLDRLSVYVQHRSRLSRRVALGAIVLCLVLLTVVGAWLMGPGLVEQVRQMVERIPEALRELREDFRQSDALPASVDGAIEDSAAQMELAPILGRLAGAFTTMTAVLGTSLVVVVIGIYLAVDPRLYSTAALYLLPQGGRERMAEVLEALGRGLGWWIVGRLSSMAIVAVLTILGLWIIGMPLFLAIGVLTGLLSFVPYLGPITAAIPALALAWSEGGTMALRVLAVLGVVQFIEGNFLTPLVLQRAVALPPALLMGAQLVMGAMVGILGVLLAAPLTVATVIMVQMLYVEDVLGRDVRKLGEHGDGG